MLPENFLAGSLYVTEQAHCSCGSAPECCCDGDLWWPAHTGASASYLPGILDKQLPDFADHGPELTRALGGLRLSLHLHGTDAFRAAH